MHASQTFPPRSCHAPSTVAEVASSAATDPDLRIDDEARRTVSGWLALCALFLTIWALTGADYFWPVWPIMGTGIGFLPTAWTLWSGRTDPQVRS